MRLQDEGATPAAYISGRAHRHARLLGAFLAGSLAVHAAGLIALRDLFHDRDQVPARVLEVTLVQAPRPPVLEAPQPVVPKPQPRTPERVAKAPPPMPQTNVPPPVLALPDARAPAAPTFTVPAPVPASAPVEARPSGAEPKTEVASVAVTPPSFSAAYLRNPAPGYPNAARRNGVQGTVTLRVLVTREGLPARVDLEKTSGSVYLDNAALDTVRTWRFTPARRGAEPVEEQVIVPIVFRLEGAG